jgi:hypothetical protein
MPPACDEKPIARVGLRPMRVVRSCRSTKRVKPHDLICVREVRAFVPQTENNHHPTVTFLTENQTHRTRHTAALAHSVLRD